MASGRSLIECIVAPIVRSISPTSATLLALYQVTTTAEVAQLIAASALLTVLLPSNYATVQGTYNGPTYSLAKSASCMAEHESDLQCSQDTLDKFN